MKKIYRVPESKATNDIAKWAPEVKEIIYVGDSLIDMPASVHDEEPCGSLSSYVSAF
jgi:hypothetical protein